MRVETLVNGICALTRDPRKLSCSYLHVKLTARKRPSMNQAASTLILDFPDCTAVRNKCVVYRLPSLYSVIAAQMHLRQWD